LLTVSSVGGVVGQPFNEAYCAAKFAVEDFMEGLAPVAAAMGVHVALIEPGAVASEFVANVGADPGRLVAEAGPYSDALRGYLSRTSGAFANAQTSAAAAIVAVLDADAGVPLPDLRDGHRQFTGLKLADLDGMRVQGLTRTWIA
jgi:short-subunit dehydrogenase